MKTKISNPKVFISYAWGTEEYQQKVIAFATELLNDGIDVVLDRWSLKEGQDTYAFMEQSVNDPEITNVLILLDPIYKQKADDRVGGVGTETQIISPEVYDKVEQVKFLPVIFERDENGDVPKPAYMNGRLHFDLTIPDIYDSEYRRLVKRLYGIEVIPKPEKGNPPAWLNETSTVSVKTRIEYESLKKDIPDQVKREQFERYFDELKNELSCFEWDDELDIIEIYNSTREIRDRFLKLFQYVSYVLDGEKIIAEKLEEMLIVLQESQQGLARENLHTLLHEVFVYLIAIYYKKHLYKHIHYTLSKSYFVRTHSMRVGTFEVFYEYNNSLSKTVCERDNKRYYSGIAVLWLENINIDVCTKNDFVLADLLCYNASVYMVDYTDFRYWFPQCYIYSGYEDGVWNSFAIKLKSLEHAKYAVEMLGFVDIDELKKRFEEINDKVAKREIGRYRYDNAFEVAPLITDYVKVEEIGMYK